MFSDQASAAAYAERIGIEYKYGCDKAGTGIEGKIWLLQESDPQACHLLGDWFEAVKRDAARATQIYEHNCDAFKYAPSCYKAAKGLVVAGGSCPMRLD